MIYFHPLDKGNWIQLFDGVSMAGWRAVAAVRADCPDGKMEWYVAGAASLNAQNPKEFDVQPGQGIMVNGPTGRTAHAVSEYLHGDCQLHIEFTLAQRSNSGVYLMGKYEIQILDSFGDTQLRSGMCGGLYPQWINEQHYGGHAPSVNASRPAGEWQSYDVLFRAPRFDEKGNKIAHARFVAVVWNGHLVHENAEVEGPTREALQGPETARGPLMLQGDHGPIAYRNIRLLPR